MKCFSPRCICELLGNGGSLPNRAVRAFPLLFPRPDGQKTPAEQKSVVYTTAEIKAFYGQKNAKRAFIADLDKIAEKSNIIKRIVMKDGTVKADLKIDFNRVEVFFTDGFLNSLKTQMVKVNKQGKRTHVPTTWPITYPDEWCGIALRSREYNNGFKPDSNGFYYPVALRIAVRGSCRGRNRLTTRKLLEWVQFETGEDEDNPKRWREYIETPFLDALKLLGIATGKEKAASYKDFMNKVWDFDKAYRKAKEAHKGG